MKFQVINNFHKIGSIVLFVVTQEPCSNSPRMVSEQFSQNYSSEFNTDCE